MSSAGIYAKVYQDGQAVEDCLMVGGRVPRIHHGDGLPVYFVAVDDRGASTACTDGMIRKLLAYPSHWPGPGEFGGRVLHGKHEALVWDASIPIFDRRD